MSNKNELPVIKKLRVGMIGLGGIATRSHLPALATLPGVAVEAGAEIDSYQAKRTQQRFNIPRIYTTYQELLEQEPLDAVYICLPNALHYQAASAALSRGLHVYCEKPVGLSAPEAEDLAKQAEQKGLILMPGYYYRFHDHFLRARDLLEERRLGKIVQVQATAVYSGPYRGWDPKSDWYFDPRNGGPLYDFGSQVLDLLMYITHLDIEFVTAMAQKSLPGIPLLDSIAAAFQAHKNIVGTLNLAWGTRGNQLMLQIHGTAGSLLVSEDYYEHRTPIGGGVNKLSTLLANSQEILCQRVGAVIHRKSTDLSHWRANQCFIEAIRGNVQIQTAKWDAVHVHQVLSAVADSVEQNSSPVRVGALRVNARQEGA
jgi:predicted dehydrogenase